MLVLPSKIAELEELPRELRIRPLANFFGQAWAETMNGLQRVSIGLFCERDWRPTDPSDPMQNTARALMAAGGMPVPIYMGGGDVEEQMCKVSGLLMPGGADMNPHLYGQPVGGDTNTSEIDSENDEFQVECVHLANRLGLPILGICRGAQVLNVALGGTLKQALDNDHQQQNPPEEPAHSLNTKPGSEMDRACRAQDKVNSKHHQAIEQVADGFEVTATAPDGTIECIERKRPWAVGCESHPEDQRKTDPEKENFFLRLVEACL